MKRLKKILDVLGSIIFILSIFFVMYILANVLGWILILILL